MKTIWVDLNSGTYGEPPLKIISVSDMELLMIANMSDEERIRWAKNHN